MFLENKTTGLWEVGLGVENHQGWDFGRGLGR